MPILYQHKWHFPFVGNIIRRCSSKRSVICCGIGKLSPCDKLVADLQTITDKLKSTTDPSTISSLQSSKNDLLNQQLKICLTETYLKAVNDMTDAEAVYQRLISRLNASKGDNASLLQSIYVLSSVVDKNNKAFLDADDAKSNKGVPFDDGTFKSVGQLQDLQVALTNTQKAIAAQVALLQSCPVKPSCPGPPNNIIQAPPAGGLTCDPAKLKTAIFADPSMTPEKLQLLQNLLTPENILKGTDIRTHKDFYKLVQSSNVQPCTDLGSGDIEKTPISNFNIEDHPDFKKNHFVPLLSVPLSRVPTDRLNDAQRIFGTSGIS